MRFLIQTNECPLARPGFHREKIDKQLAQKAQHDALIELLRTSQTEGGEEALSAAVKQRVSKIDVGLFVRLADMAEATAVATEREELIALSQQIMSVVEATGQHSTLSCWKIRLTIRHGAIVSDAFDSLNRNVSLQTKQQQPR